MDKIRIVKNGEVFFSYAEYKEQMLRRTPEYSAWLHDELVKAGHGMATK